MGIKWYELIHCIIYSIYLSILIYLISYSVETSKCVELKRRNRNHFWPINRLGCTMEYYDNHLYLIGGHSSKDRPSVLKFAIDENKWTVYNTESILVRARYMSSCVYNEYIIFYGGIGISNDFYVFNIKLNKWSIIPNIKDRKSRTYFHDMVIHNDLLIIFGGEYRDRTISNEMYMVNINDFIQNISDLKWIKTDLNIGSLTRHSMSSIDNKLCIFGGQTDLRNYSNTLYVFSDIMILNENTFHDIINRCSNTMDIPHGIISIIHRFHGNNNNFICYKTDTINKISARGNHESCGININNKSYMFVLGGHQCGSETPNDAWLISV